MDPVQKRLGYRIPGEKNGSGAGRFRPDPMDGRRKKPVRLGQNGRFQQGDTVPVRTSGHLKAQASERSPPAGNGLRLRPVPGRPPLIRGLGVDLELDRVAEGAEVGTVERLFNESAGRFLVEVDPDNREAFEAAIGDIPASRVGEVTSSGRILARFEGTGVLDVSLDDAKAAWQGTFATA